MLLNYDNEMYAKILANKIQQTLEDIISPQASSSSEDGTIIENLQLNQDVMPYANASKIQAAMITLDQNKHLTGLAGIFSLKPYNILDMDPK